MRGRRHWRGGDAFFENFVRNMDIIDDGIKGKHGYILAWEILRMEAENILKRKDHAGMRIDVGGVPHVWRDGRLQPDPPPASGDSDRTKEVLVTRAKWLPRRWRPEDKVHMMIGVTQLCVSRGLRSWKAEEVTCSVCLGQLRRLAARKVAEP